MADFNLIVNKKEHSWPTRFITKADILTLAGSPATWVVNRIVPGPGDDPEVTATEQVDLDHQAEPKDVKRFQTRLPATDPGA